MFHEVQTFRDGPAWRWICGAAGVAWIVFAAVFLFYTVNSMAFAVGVLTAGVVGILLPFGFAACRLVTSVRHDGIYVRFVPFHRSFRRFTFTDLQECEVRLYQPIRDYGGWGIRSSRLGKAYNVCGNQGVQLQFRDGRRLLIGSQRAEQLLLAIQENHSLAGTQLNVAS